MKKLFTGLMGLLSLTSLFAQKTFNDPNAEIRTVKSFNGIRVSNAFDVYITQGNEEAVAVSASTAEFRSRIITTVENGLLVIKVEDDKKFWKGMGGDKTKFKAYISVKNLDRLYVGGACNVHMESGLKAAKLTLHLSGASDMKARLDVQDLVVEVSGASDMELSGSAQSVDAEVSGASSLRAFEFNTDYCSADANGASSISITVNKEIKNAEASGASSIRYKGDGLIRNIRTSGAGSVSRKS